MKQGIMIFLLFCLIKQTAESQYGFNIKRTFGETSHQIYSASLNADGKYIVTTGSDNNIIIWNAGTGIIFRTLAGAKKIPKTAVFSSGSDLVASGGDDNIITLWDVKTANIIGTFEGLLGAVKAVDISPDGKLIAGGGADRSIKVWNITSRTLVFDLKGHKDDVNVLKFSPDGKILASGGADKRLILWNPVNGNIIKSREVHQGWIRDIEFDSKGRTIASCGDDNLIRTSTVPDLDPVTTFKGHKAWVQAIDYSQDGKFLLSGGHDNIIILWDALTGKILAQSEKQAQIVVAVDFAPAGQDFISATLRSENLETWAFSGMDYTALEKTQVIMEERAPDRFEMAEERQEKTERDNKKIITLEEVAVMGKESMIEIFDPFPVDGSAVADTNSIYIIGRASDREGINVLLVNKNPLKLSEAGVFEFRMNLSQGENPVSIIAINNKGKMNELNMKVYCTAESISFGQESASAAEGKYYALLIGINDYQNGEITDLDNPLKDAESLYNVLSDNYTFDKENIIFLRNPTQSEIITTFDGLTGKLTANDNLLIFYAGHGYWDEKGKVGYWFPSDATRNSTVNWFRNSTLRDFIGSIQTKHTLLIADACFSGAIFKTRAAFNDAPQGIRTLDELPSRKAMTSGILQEVPDESVFIKYLVGRLGENEEKFLTSELLFSSFKTAVMNNSNNVPQYGVIQNVGDEGGDFIFVKR